jgi:hypothetical protein
VTHPAGKKLCDLSPAAKTNDALLVVEFAVALADPRFAIRFPLESREPDREARVGEGDGKLDYQ